MKSYNPLKHFLVPEIPIKKIICFYDSKNILLGFRLIDSDGNIIFKSSNNYTDKGSVTTELLDGERIVGIRGHIQNNQATYYDF